MGGMFDIYSGPNEGSAQPRSHFRQRVFPGHVLDVCLDQDSSLYENPRDVGKIRFRDLANLGAFYPKAEDQVSTFAWPLDRSIMRYPVPGEQVIIYAAFGDVLMPTTDSQQVIYFYSTVVSTNHNVSYNESPFLLSNKDTITQKGYTSHNQAKIRFTSKLQDLTTFKQNNKVKIYKQLQPLEGDFILQGRFGNSIRFGSTSTTTATDGPWKSGKPGDPIMVLRVDGEFTTDIDDMYVTEDVNRDDASIYLTSTQKVDVLLQCTKEMKSWKKTYDIVDAGKDNQLDRVPTTSELYQKIIDTTKPVDQEYKSDT